ncbi:hypothetical protein GCM10009825_13170 [Arthrobacter humicola]|uniref:DUF3027 domain-containing protein n=1 Tax=Arthrobacter humicola TaxID=409291 RepID=A0ABP5KFG5_9MICC
MPAPDAGSKVPAGSKGTGPKQGPRPRAGVPVWRTGKPDAFLAAAVDVARAAVESIAPAEQIGEHLGARSEGDRLVTHLFESRLPGYLGWQWYAVLTRNSRSKVVTVDELGLLPSEDSILAPAWVPWAERVRPEDAQTDETEEAAGAQAPSQGPDAEDDVQHDGDQHDGDARAASEQDDDEQDATEDDAAEYDAEDARERSADEAD